MAAGALYPPFSFRSYRKENGPCTVQKKRTLLVATLHLWSKVAVRGSAYRCLLRFGLAAGQAWAFCWADTAVPWRMVQRLSGWGCRMDFLLFPLPLPWQSGTARSPGASRSDPAVQFLIPNSQFLISIFSPLSTLHSPLYLLSLPLPVLSCRRAGGGLFMERSFP